MPTDPKQVRALRRKAEKLLSETPEKLACMSGADLKELVQELSVYQIELEMQNEDLRKSQEQLEQSRSEYADLYDFAPVGYLTFNKMGITTKINLTACGLLGVERNLLINKPFALSIHPGSQDIFYFHKQKALETTTTQTCHLVLKRKEGAFFDARLESIAVEVNGQPAVNSVLTDITERNRAERVREQLESQLRQARERKIAEEVLQKAHDELEQRVRERTQALRRQADLLELAYNAIFVRDPESRITFWNARAEELYGWTGLEALGKISHTLLKTRFPVPFGEYIAALTKDGRWEGELVHTTKDGRQITVLSRQALQRDEGGNPAAILEIDLDVTEARRTEQQLRQAQKMDALWTLTGGIAHDFNNALAAIIGFTELVAGHAAKGSRDEHYLKRIMEASIRSRELVRQMLTFTRQAEQEKKPLRLISIVKETVRLLRASIPTTISIRVDAQNESGLILGDPTQVQQVLINLCTNAAFAMREKGGTLGLELSEFSVSESKGNPDGIKPGYYIKLVVSDTGIGIPPDIIDRIFDPFFTTKKFGEGTGLGLSVVHGIVNQSGGAITMISEQGLGSAFTVYFPKVAEGSVDAAASHTPLPTGSERILFVDDEESLAEMGEELLAELGYNVTSRTNSKEALALLKEDPYRFDLVISDQTMPDITGVDLAKEIIALRPDMPVILCTGFSHTVDEKSARAAGINAFAMKPLTKGEIARTIREVLDA